jgi:hypothetical protein
MAKAHPRSKRCGVTSCRLFDGYAFRKIPRLINITAPLDAGMVREKLQGNDVDEGREQRMR